MNRQDAKNEDVKTRLFIFQYFVDHGVAPSFREISEALQTDVSATLQRLHEGHILVLKEDQIAMMMPFSAAPTNYKVQAGAQSWWANCGWDALGISAALKREAEITCNCADCGDAIRLTATGAQVIGQNEVLHFALPVKKWWENVFFT